MRPGERGAKPRLGFLGVGWIGLDRMRAVIAADAAEVAAIADPSEAMRDRACALAPGAACVDSLEALLDRPLDGLVVATPSALHAAQSIAALERGLAVFCQKPLGRDAHEVERVVATARRVNRLLAIDLCYRHTRAARAIKDLVASGELGDVHAARLVFHNAYGPDQPWYYERASAGGGCVIDLGIHLVDLARFFFEGDAVSHVRSRLFHRGTRLRARSEQVEDFALAEFELGSGAVVELACSWRLPAGTDAVIGAELYGTGGGAAFRNVDGSFYDFVAERFRGTRRERLVEPPDAWGGRAIVAWAERLRASHDYAAEADELVALSVLLDAITLAA